MKLHYIKEPFLEFGRGTHICPRTGITEYDVYDTKLRIRRERVFLGAVGTSDMLSKLYSWLEKCSQPIPPQKDSKQPNLIQTLMKSFGLKTGMHESMQRLTSTTAKLNF